MNEWMNEWMNLSQRFWFPTCDVRVKRLNSIKSFCFPFVFFSLSFSFFFSFSLLPFQRSSDKFFNLPRSGFPLVNLPASDLMSPVSFNGHLSVAPLLPVASPHGPNQRSVGSAKSGVDVQRSSVFVHTSGFQAPIKRDASLFVESVVKWVADDAGQVFHDRVAVGMRHAQIHEQVTPWKRKLLLLILFSWQVV